MVRHHLTVGTDAPCNRHLLSLFTGAQDNTPAKEKTACNTVQGGGSFAQRSEMDFFKMILGMHLNTDEVRNEAFLFHPDPSADFLLAFALRKAFEKIELLEERIASLEESKEKSEEHL